MQSGVNENSANHQQSIRPHKGIYLLVADRSEEFSIALLYAARLATSNDAHIALAYVIEKQDFQHWGNIEDRMRQEVRQDAEQFLFGIAKSISELTGQIPALYIEEGEKADVLVDLIDADHNIKTLILGGGMQGAPGPLVAYFSSSKGLARLRVPLTIVPGHLQPQQVERIFDFNASGAG
jgi:hypothetical protein